MKRATQWILSLSLRLAFIQLLLNLGYTTLVGRKLTTTYDANPGFISIDCGSKNDYFYKDTGIWYQNDTNFVESGANSRVLPSTNLEYPYFGGLLETLRSFPEGKRNCYTLKPEQGKNNPYLIRAYFAYGNYDGKNKTPTFDLYLGVNYWQTMNPTDYYDFAEIIHTPTTDTIHVCLVKTVMGIPFISALELRPLSNSIYQTPSPSQSLLVLQGRFDVASLSSATHSRYKDDIYDRLWRKINVTDWYPFNGSVDIDPGNANNSYKLPAQVLRSAAQPLNGSYALNYDFDAFWKDLDRSSKYYVFFHFAEIMRLPPGQKRVINITLNDEITLSQPIILEYLNPLTIQKSTQGNVRFNISATSESDPPPILNAFEVYQLISSTSPTDQRDVDAILDIKNTYKITKADWQVDPCVPKVANWEGLNCSYGINDNNARITSVNLSACQLTGQIATSFSQLTELESLDLSFNDLSGSLPEFLAELPKLRILNLTGNKLTGLIPKALKEKSEVTLTLSLADNPGLHLTEPNKKQKFVIPLVVSISALIVIFLLVSLIIWIFKANKLKVDFTISKKEESSEIKHRAFSRSKVLSITSNLQNLIGEGGFGKVYLGILKNDTKVAVKLLSQSSTQGHREFQSEVELLMVVHHRHLVSLIGYCEEGGMRALIYEYMANGNLRQHLSDENPKVLKWKERLQIALDAAHGLDYLHNGCKAPIIHRDLKTSNILLNENMLAKISDFGLSRAFANEIDTHVSTRPAGTLGYLDPEFQSSGNLTKRSDIYSFGIILLELITGKPAIRREPNAISHIHILQWVIPKLKSEDIQSIVDPRLPRQYSADSARKFLEIAMSCTASSAIQRPEISEVVAELRECLAVEITMERSRGNINSSSSLATSSSQFDSDFILSGR